jgi:hypothetical protein
VCFEPFVGSRTIISGHTGEDRTFPHYSETLSLSVGDIWCNLTGFLGVQLFCTSGLERRTVSEVSEDTESHFCRAHGDVTHGGTVGSVSRSYSFPQHCLSDRIHHEARSALDNQFQYSRHHGQIVIMGTIPEVQRNDLSLVVRFFIDTQNRLVVLHSVLVKDHEETDINPRSVIYRPIGSTKQCSKINPPTSRRPTKFWSLLVFLVSWYIRQNPLPKEGKFNPKWLCSVFSYHKEDNLYGGNIARGDLGIFVVDFPLYGILFEDLRWSRVFTNPRLFDTYLWFYYKR